MPAIAKPVVHQLEDIRLWVSPSSNLDLGGDVAVALLEPGGVASIHPEHPRLRRPLACALGMLDGMLDGKLRLSSLPLACSAC